MSSARRLAPLFFLQVIPLILYPPSLMASGAAVLAVVAIAYLALGYMVLRGRSWALTLTIFSQGLNVIVRLMMFFSRAVTVVGETRVVDVAWIVTGLVGMALSVWFLLRFDRQDVRLLMTS
jgi:uncharacterized membrane protein